MGLGWDWDTHTFDGVHAASQKRRSGTPALLIEVHSESSPNCGRPWALPPGRVPWCWPVWRRYPVSIVTIGGFLFRNRWDVNFAPWRCAPALPAKTACEVPPASKTQPRAWAASAI